MKYIHCVLFVFLFGLFFIISACNSSRGQKNGKQSTWMTENGKKKILCTTAMVASLVEKIGGDAIDCLTLIQGEHDPHSYQLVKGDDEKLDRADFIFSNGLGLEHGASLAYRLKSSQKACALGDYILKVNPNSILYIDGTIDPHVWMDVSLWSQAIPIIAEKLITLLPDYKDQIKKNEEALFFEMDSTHKLVKARFSQVPEKLRYLVTTHDAFNYFSRAYLTEEEELRDNLWRLRFQAPEGLAPDSQLSTVDIQRLLEHVMKKNIHVVFSESNVSRDSLKKLVDACRQKGYPLFIAKEPLFADSIGPFSGPGAYLNMIEYDAHVIIQGFLGNEE